MAITFNHLNLLASAGNEATYLLTDVLGLKNGNRPNFPFKGSWLYQGDQALIHIIESDTQQCGIGHIAFDTDMSLETLTQKLQQNATRYNVRQVPDSNVIQVFVRAGEVIFELITLDTSSQQNFDVFNQHQELL
ncbi:hypothetical protein CXF83_04060 [Shewanella sp. Choline-02u-19]|jgi:hypothetical protein|uniref:hypothetical protein n=1 Tax=Shewanella TaxID=22 RepID=UPI000C32C692|nr:MULTISPECIES: hypothetical protein [Shewanella]MCL1056730.1 hypothetical protein [Shewanella gelidimarina]PKG56877.1 hypothetical protein CXF82_12350 [Shewanella sp. GutDb-MelDb]PKG74426.1 hypothetical protein CXF86_13025 [Shewanella sp. GutCb]PKH57748.1 hypothetical protein CXF84_07115 [Shewanella sp. Bg11-22]PKI29833.1 hypothetical protein CXF83_04060 [Shewanella sp. Choline-02u-19]